MEKSHWFCCLKNQQTIGLLSKLRHLVSTHTLISIYSSLIARYLRYGLVAWGQASKNELDKLLILQKRALRYIFFANRRDHAIPLFLKAEILPIHCLHYKLLAETMHDISNDLVPSNLKKNFLPKAKVHSYNTRSSASKNFFIKKSRLEIKRNSFSRVGARLWNELPTKLRMQPKIKFKKKIRWILFNILVLEDNYIDVEILIRQLKNHYS